MAAWLIPPEHLIPTGMVAWTHGDMFEGVPADVEPCFVRVVMTESGYLDWERVVD